MAMLSRFVECGDVLVLFVLVCVDDAGGGERRCTAMSVMDDNDVLDADHC